AREQRDLVRGECLIEQPDLGYRTAGPLLGRRDVVDEEPEAARSADLREATAVVEGELRDAVNVPDDPVGGIPREDDLHVRVRTDPGEGVLLLREEDQAAIQQVQAVVGRAVLEVDDLAVSVEEIEAEQDLDRV